MGGIFQSWTLTLTPLRKHGRQMYYKVWWKGYSKDSNAWLMKNDLESLSVVKPILLYYSAYLPMLIVLCILIIWQKNLLLNCLSPFSLIMTWNGNWAPEGMFCPIHGDFINPSALWMEIHWPITSRPSYAYLFHPNI